MDKKNLLDKDLTKVKGGAIGVDSKSNIIKLYDENTGKEYGYFPNTEEGLRLAIKLAQELGISITKVYE